MTVTLLRQVLRPYPWVLPALVSFGFLVSLAEGLSIGLLIPVFQSLLDSDQAQKSGPFTEWVDRYAAAFEPDQRLWLLGATISALILGKAMAQFAHTYTGDWLNGRVAHDLRTRLAKQLLDVEYTFVLHQQPGRLLDSMQHQTWRAGEIFSRLSEIIITAATVLVYSIILLLISWQTTLVVGVGILIAGCTTRFFIYRAKRLGDKAVQSSELLVDRMVELINNMRMIHAFGQEQREYQRFANASNQEWRGYMATDLTAAILNPLMEVLSIALLMTTLFTAVFIGTSIPVLMTSLVLLYRMLPKLQHFQSSRVHLMGLLGGIDGIGQLLRTDDKPYLSDGQIHFERLSDRIEFQHVSFDYRAYLPDASQPKRQPALIDLNFGIRSGELTAIVGRSGAGKSTIAHLLCRFGDPEYGQVVVDGTPLSAFSLNSWRAGIAIAGQDADLFNCTIAENIAYAKPDASHHQIEEAARKAQAHDFITAMTEGYNTSVSSRGRSLSAGQRQRIGLARALLANPCLLILDEPTSALDNTTAAELTKIVASLRGELTILVIAHRLETIINADNIIVLANGAIVEQGRREELCANNGEFAQLYALEQSATASES